MRLIRFAVAGLAILAVVPLAASSQNAPSVSEIPRLVALMRQLEAVPESQLRSTVSRLSSSDRDGLMWIMKTVQANPSAYSTQSYSVPSYSPPAYSLPTYNYEYRPAPAAKPRTSYSSGYSYEPTTVITANPYLGTPISKYDSRVNKYSTDGATNPYTTGGGKIYGADGTYLGKLNANKYDQESVANPYGQYGSKYSSTSINNPYSEYGSKYSSKSATNPYAITPPRVIYGDPEKK
jgi:hypothetical protein